MRTLPDVMESDSKKRWRLGTVFDSSVHSYRYVQAGEKLKAFRCVKLGTDKMYVMSYVNKTEDIFSATELSVEKEEYFWLRVAGSEPFRIETDGQPVREGVSLQ